MVIQQLEGLTTEIDALAQFLEALDEDYVGAEPAGDRSIRTIFQEIYAADASLSQLSGSKTEPLENTEELDFAALLIAVKTQREKLVGHLKNIPDPKREVFFEDENSSLLDLSRMTAVANSGDLREIAYRLHGSQRIFKGLEPRA